MIQSTAPNAASATSQVSGLLSGQPAENGVPGAETGGFAQVLADREAPARGPGAARAPAEPGEPDSIAPAPSPALAQPNLAAALPLTGKILPGLLPDAGTAAGGPGEPAHEPGAESVGQAVPGLLAALRALRLPSQDTGTRKTPLRADQPQTVAGPDSDDGEPAASAVWAGFAIQASPTPAIPVTTAAADAAAGALPPMIEAQLLGRPLPQGEGLPPAAVGAETKGKTAADPALALRLDPARIDPRAAGDLRFEAGSARPMSAVSLRPELALERENPLSAAASSSDGAGLLASPLGPNAALATPNAPLGATHAAQPHDFAALMDRLIAARDAAQTGLPQSVQVALNHAEFGQVSLSFQHDQRGLAVSVASADPDFARAVQAAIPAAGAATSADAGSRDGGQGSGQTASGSTGQGLGRGDASAAGGEPGQRQGRTARFDADAPLPAANRRAEARDSTTSRPRGIFA
ncbi:hypothetical protein H7F50_04930 [Novosphingobium flavum]|uniref:hypothetical protein n=1 Tax=Novosphingobium aerophilum TaxID=2839843 RepID=UPI00163983CE|nr:hypothetical protein [Novosphingobium aerophilum]MBC2661089.1 hypothetical protein [Novosphingobium aerophilum]